MIREYWIVLGIIILALLYVLFNFIRVKKMDEGTDEMKEMAGIIRSGASMCAPPIRRGPPVPSERPSR